MSNDNGLVDEYDRLQCLKKELEEKIEKMRWEIIRLAQNRNTEVLFGTHKKCAIKSYMKVIYP